MSITDGTEVGVVRWRVTPGFRVYSKEGYVGTVEAVRCDRGGEPEIVGVRSGLLVRRTSLVPARSVACVMPRERRVLLNGDSGRSCRRTAVNGPSVHHTKTRRISRPATARPSRPLPHVADPYRART
jgi:hypothetical protein